MLGTSPADSVTWEHGGLRCRHYRGSRGLRATTTRRYHIGLHIKIALSKKGGYEDDGNENWKATMPTTTMTTKATMATTTTMPTKTTMATKTNYDDDD